MKKNNSLLITILSGAVFCFVCLGMVLLFPGNTRNLKSEESPLPNAGEHGYMEDEEISLGDECSSCASYNSWSCTSNNDVHTGSTPSGCSSTAPTTGTRYTKCVVTGSDSSGPIWHTETCTRTCARYACTSCSEGKYLNSNQECETCPAGSYCSGATAQPATCPAGTYSTGGARECSQCNGSKEYSGSGASSCSTCANEQVANSSHTGCDEGVFTCPGSYYADTGASTYSQCYKNVAAGYSATWSGGSHTISACTGNTYSSSRKVYYGQSSECTPCDGEVSADKTTCNPRTKCGAGQGADSSQTSGCGNCAAGYYSPANDDECHKCESGKVSGPGSSSCKTVTAPCCVTNSTLSRTTIEDLNGCQQAVKGGATVTNGACPVTSNPVVTRVSSSASGTIYLNSNDIVPTNSSDSTAAGSYGYRTVTYVAYDQNNQVIAGTKLSWSVSNSSVVASQAANGNGYVVTYKGLGCYKPNVTVSVTARGTGDVTGSATSSSITIVTKYHAWQQSEYNSANTNNYPHLHDGYESDSCIAVSDPYVENGVTKYKYQYNRCCGSSSTTPATPVTPETPVTPQVPYCYVDNDGEYHWTTSPESSWKIIGNITKEADCQKTENEACYINPSGTYVWGKYSKQSGYTLITSISSSDLCKNPVAGEACYKNDQGDYIWTSIAPYGYTKVDTAKSPVECTPPENPACYLYGNEFVWGKYERITGYIFVENITEEKDCKTPDNDACYVDSKGDYVWGKYGNTEGYTLVPSVTEMSQCKNNVPVPKTGISISKIIYIFMAILMAFGVGFIYYSSAVKKND